MRVPEDDSDALVHMLNTLLADIDDAKELVGLSDDAKLKSNSETLTSLYNQNTEQFKRLGNMLRVRLKEKFNGNPNSSTEPNEHAVLKSTPDSKPKKTKRKRRRHDYGFDLTLLAALSISVPNRPIGLKELHQVARSYDPSSNDASVTSKLQRWKDDELIEWDESDRRHITDLGKKELENIKAFVDEERRQRVRNAIKQELDADVGFGISGAK